MSSLTWGAAKRRIARVANQHDDPDGLTAAGEYLSEVLEDWNTRREWKFLQTLADDIAVSPAGGATYTLPSRVKKPYAAVLVTTQAPLTYVPRRYWTRQGGDFSSAAATSRYTTFNTETTGKIELLPAPGASDTLRVWYYRLMTESGADGATLDILQRYEGYILNAARAQMCVEKGYMEKGAYFEQKAEAGYLRAVADDNTQPDFDVQFVSGYQVLPTVSPNSIAIALEGEL